MAGIRMQDLTRPLAAAATPHQQALIAATIFGDNVLQEKSQHLMIGLDAYFQDWYNQQCRDCAQQVSAKTHQDLLDAIELIQEDDATQELVLQKLRAKILPLGPVTEIRLKATITLAMRVSCAISIGTIDGSFPPGTTMRGLDGVNSSIRAHIMSIFEPGPLTDEIVKLPRIFNARNLVKIAGIQICWTSNLADHLLMTDDETKVTIFHHGSFLKLHSASKQNLLSQELIEETLNTFTLLLPSNDPAVQKWFRKQQAKQSLDETAAKCGHLSTRGRDIKNFKFWKDRLIILKQAFDDAEPRSVTQWWYDDRKRVQWYTFWVAALVLLLIIVFGVIQSATAVVQTWKTMHS